MEMIPPSISWEDEVAKSFEGIAHLPFPIYVSTFGDGKFRRVNAQAIEFFGFAKEEEMLERSVLVYYETPSERERVLEIIQQIPPGQWSQRIRVRLKINGEIRRIHFISQVFRDGHGVPQALLCMALNVAEGEWFAGFEEGAKEGLFEASHYRITDCNRAFARMLGYNDVQEMLGYSVKELFWSPESLERIIERIREKREIRNEQVKLRRRDGAMLIAQLSCKGTFNEEGKLVHVSGGVYNSAAEAIQRDLPVGVFLISTDQNGEEVIAYANDNMAKVLGYEKAEEVLNEPIRRFHVSEAAFKSFREELDRAADNGRPLLDYNMEVLDSSGQRRRRACFGHV